MRIRWILGIFLVAAFIMVAATGIILAGQSGYQTGMYGQNSAVEEPQVFGAELTGMVLPVLNIMGFTGLITVIQKAQH